jgi:ElaB/YqjD/DUF883 family membrane-anchored ribosome-binding protein
MDSSTTTGEIERELDDTRSRLDATIDALQQKLAPGSMVEEAVTYFKEGGGVEFTQNLGRSVRENPIPVALIGIGVGWLVLNGSRRGDHGHGDWRDRSWADEGRFGGANRDVYGRGLRNTGMGYPRETSIHQPMPYEAAARDDTAIRAHEAGSALHRYPDEAESAFQERVHEARGAVLGLTRRAGEAADSFKQRVEEAMHAAGERVGSMMQSVADMAGSVVDRGQAASRDMYGYGSSAASGVRDMGSRSVDFVQERPLLLGALGLAVGAVIGMLVPSSRYERRMAGTVRQQLGDAARDLASEARDRAMHVADAVLDTAHDAAQREGLNMPSGGVAAAARETVADVSGRARRVVEETATAGREALRRELAGEPEQGTSNGGASRPDQRAGQGGERRAGA